MSFTFLDTTRTIHHLPVSDSQKYHPLSAVIPRLPGVFGASAKTFAENSGFFPPHSCLEPRGFPVRSRPRSSPFLLAFRRKKSPGDVAACITMSRARGQHHLAGEYENPAKQQRGPWWLPKTRRNRARVTEFREDRRTATMNISPGPRIIIRNEIALESLINRRAANAVALGMREATSIKGDDCDFSHRESSSLLMLPASHWKHS